MYRLMTHADGTSDQVVQTTVIVTDMTIQGIGGPAALLDCEGIQM